MAANSKILSIGIDGMWMPMEFARLLHLVVRFYRLEQLIVLSDSGGANFFADRLDAVTLKYLAAFDWIAAPLMSEKFNESYARSEEFVRDFGVSDLRVHKLSYDPTGVSPGSVEFTGIVSIVDTIFDVFRNVLRLKQSSQPGADDSRGKSGEIEVIYARRMKTKANLMQDMGYSDAELHAIVSPSVEDLHFISNAMTQGKIVAVEKSPVAR
ncbi:MAG: hypothetical protein ACTSVG_07135 [Alphaproteobacteria bacterium]